MKYTIGLAVGILMSGIFALAQYTPRVLWDRSGAGPRSYYGNEAYALGDQNDDGYTDWMVCSWGDSVLTPSESVVELFHGGNPPSTEPYRTFRADPDTAVWLWHGKPVGDINGDGYIDWIIETYYRHNLWLATGELWYGGPVPVEDSLMAFAYDWTFLMFAGVGDINGDGYDDLCLADLRTETSRYLFGSPHPDTVVDWQMSSPPGQHYLATPVSTGDVNGDGRADYVTDWDDRLSLVLGANPPDSIPDLTCTGTVEYTTTILPDITGDGYADIVRYGPGTNQGRVRPGGPVPTCDVAYTLPFPVCDAGVTNIVGLGDINGDGFNDFGLIGWHCHLGWGKLDVFLGGNPLPSVPAFTISGRTAPLNLIGIGTAVGLGDVNGDGINDFIVGAYNDDGDGTRGRAVVLSGDTDLVAGVDPSEPPVPSAFAFTLYPNPTNAAVTLQIDAGPGPTAELTVYNLLGQAVFTRIVTLGFGPTQLTLDLAALSSGLYIVQLQRATAVARQKLMILK